MPRAHPSAGDPAAQTRRDDHLRELPPHSVSGEIGILRFIANVDGASRGNPGHAGYGAYLRGDDGTIIEAYGYLGTTTNNVAEYSGLLEALRIAIEEGARELEVISDSLLLVSQMQGKYRVKHPNLVPLFSRAVKLARQLPSFSIRHVLRAENKDADRLANLAIDSRDPRVVERRKDAV